MNLRAAAIFAFSLRDPFASAVSAGYVQGEQIGAWTYERALRPVGQD